MELVMTRSLALQAKLRKQRLLRTAILISTSEWSDRLDVPPMQSLMPKKTQNKTILGRKRMLTLTSSFVIRLSLSRTTEGRKVSEAPFQRLHRAEITHLSSKLRTWPTTGSINGATRVTLTRWLSRRLGAPHLKRLRRG